MSGIWGTDTFSSSGAYAMGTSSPASRTTGALSVWKVSDSTIRAAISATNPAFRGASWTSSAFPVAATGKVLLVQEAPRTAGFAAEIAARIVESDAFHTLKAPIVRLCGLDVPMAYAPELEKVSVPQVPDIVSAARTLVRNGSA